MTEPWHLTHTIRRAQGYLVATVALTVSWYGTATSTVPRHQILFVAAGIAAVTVAGASEGLWLLGGLHSIRGRRAALQLNLSRVCAPGAPLPVATRGLVVVPAGTLFHESSCPAARGKQQRRASAQQQSSLRPCPLCLPAMGLER